jgi:hypothetical protein
MGRSDSEWTDWARTHRVAYEIMPLVEMRGGEKLQVGFTLSFYAEAEAELAPGAEDAEASEKLKQELTACAEAALEAEERVARTEPDPESAVMMRPENDLKPEVCLSWRIFHKDDYLKPVTEADREGLTICEKRLRELGLKRGHW